MKAMARQRSHSIEFKRQVAQEFIAGESLYALSKRHDTHNYPIFPNLEKNIKLDGPNQLWVADITYVTIATGFVYLAAILDAWSRRVVGYAISRSIDARLAVAALKAAISARNPLRGCVHHSDRGSQYASEDYRA
jgi:putative transposase